MTTVKEEVFEYLKKMGLMPEYDNDGDIRFMYQMCSIAILFTDKKDERYLPIVLTSIFRVDENNRLDVLEACHAVTACMKVVKCLISSSNRVYLSAELLLDKTPGYEDILPRALRALITARTKFKEEITK